MKFIYSENVHTLLNRINDQNKKKIKKSEIISEKKFKINAIHIKRSNKSLILIF